MTPTSLQSIRSNITAWDGLRNNKVAISFLTSGFGFCIKKSDFQSWLDLKPNTNPSFIHCYLGINGLELEFYLVDDVSDTAEQYLLGQSLFVKEFVRRIDPNSLPPGQAESFKPIKFANNGIGVDQAEDRVMRWILSSQFWFQDQMEKVANNNGDGVLQVITIPFQDLQSLFQDSDSDVYAMFAMKDYNDPNHNYGYNLELILAHVVDVDSPIPVNVRAFQDVTQPHPPFSLATAAFNLLT